MVIVRNRRSKMGVTMRKANTSTRVAVGLFFLLVVLVLYDARIATPSSFLNGSGRSNSSMIFFPEDSAGNRRNSEVDTGSHLRKSRDQWVSEQSQPFNENNAARDARNLIVVAGHSVTVSGHLEDAGTDEQDWFLLDYQKHRGLPEAIAGHIRAGLEAARADPQALLLYSGGETRATTGPLTEASSYFRVTDAMRLWPAGSNVRARTMTEEFATDSFENLMFAICRFREITGRYPERITVVSFTFKEHRFKTLHARALRWPNSQFSYIGVDPPAASGFRLDEASKGEAENAAKPFETDPYGCHSPVLQEKRRGRNPFSRTPPYRLTCPDMEELLQYCGRDYIDPQKLPWGKSVG